MLTELITSYIIILLSRSIVEGGSGLSQLGEEISSPFILLHIHIVFPPLGLLRKIEMIIKLIKLNSIILNFFV